MTLRVRGLLVVACLTVIVALLATFPARVAYSWVSPPFVRISGIDGTIWNGSARSFSTHGVYLTDLSWTMRPLRLLTGTALFEVSGSPVAGFFESEVAVSFGGAITLRDLRASLPLQMFESAANIAGLRGSASLQFERLELVEGRPAAMDGTLDIANLVVPVVAGASLGGYRAEFFTQNNGIVASVEDTDGVVDLAGSLQLRNDKTYAFLGQIAAKPNTPEQVSRQLRFLPPGNGQGQHELRLEGSY
ncbi:MAG: type II secretion system protein N [Woeseiaceae bacterium]|nr:type II secretion system protein N [Woeseiaceae bacterium]